MPDKKLTDAEIKKALNTALGMEHISIYCANIKNEVQTIRVLDIINLINRLQEENERLKGFATAKCEDCAGCTSWKCDCANIKAEAYKEFADRLRSKAKKTTITYVTDTSIQEHGTGWIEISLKDFDNLLKELVGGENGEEG